MVRPAPPHIPLAADEMTTLVAFLDFYRAALIDRARELDAQGLTAAPLPTSLSLARLIGHMTYVEYTWFQDRFDGQGYPEPFVTFDWDADDDAEMTMVARWTPEQVFAEFWKAVEDSRARVAAAASLDQLSVVPNQAGEHWNLRWIMVHMIEEYARHTGHADLIREAVDGDVLS